MSRFRIWYYGQPRAIRMLLAINVVAYLVWQIVLIHFDPTATFVYRHVALNPNLPGILYEPWQLLTYAFLHLSPGFGGLLHILFNMLWMMWIGREYEQLEGPRKMFALYILGGIGGGLMTVILHAIFPTAGAFGGIVHGASGSVLAIMAGVGFLYPHKTIALFFIGVVRLIHVVFAFIFLDILFLAAGGTSISAHWGGVLTGYLWAKSAKWGLDLSGWAGIFYPNRMPRESMLERLESIFAAREQKKKTRKPGGGGIPGVTVTERESRPRHAAPAAATSTQPDVDAILDKISEEGYDALTSEEKRILYEASKKD